VAMIVGLINIGWSWAIIFWSEQFVPSGLVAVFGAAAPIWTAVLAHFMVKGDRLSALKIIGLVLGLAGTVLLIGPPDSALRPAWLFAKRPPSTHTRIQVLARAEAFLIGTLRLGEPVTFRMRAGAALVVAAVALNASAGAGTPPAEERLAASAAPAD